VAAAWTTIAPATCTSTAAPRYPSGSTRTTPTAGVRPTALSTPQASMVRGAGSLLTRPESPTSLTTRSVGVSTTMRRLANRGEYARVDGGGSASSPVPDRCLFAGVVECRGSAFGAMSSSACGPPTCGSQSVSIRPRVVFCCTIYQAGVGGLSVSGGALQNRPEIWCTAGAREADVARGGAQIPRTLWLDESTQDILEDYSPTPAGGFAQ
jgi:hypothetical protein